MAERSESVGVEVLVEGRPFERDERKFESLGLDFVKLEREEDFVTTLRTTFFIVDMGGSARLP